MVTSKIADQNVTKEKIADQSVDNSKLSPEAVTYDKLKDKSVITEKLNDRAVTTEKVEEKAITNTKLGDQSVDGRVVREASIEGKHIGNNAVSTSKIASRSVTNEKIAQNSVSRAELTPDVRNSIDKKADTEQVNNSLYDLEKKIGDRFVVEGNVTNLPDDEDLTSVKESERDVLKLADRSYAPQNFSGKGYKILRKNIKQVSIAVTKIQIESAPSADGTLSFTINGKETQVAVSATTDNTTALVAQKVAAALQDSMVEYHVSVDASLITLTRKSGGSVTPSVFSAGTTGIVCTVTDSTKREFRNFLTAVMLSEANTIYEIRYDFDLDGATVEMKEGCTLKFKGGSLSNGCIDGNVEIKASKYKIFDNIIFSKINYLSTCFVEWFGADGGSQYADYDKIRDSTKAINESLKYFVKVKLSNYIYKVSDTIHISAVSFFCGNSTTLAFVPCNPKDNKYMVIFGENKDVYTVSLGRITDISFLDKSDDLGVGKSWLGIYAASSIFLKQVYVGHARSALNFANKYIDTIRIEKCNFFYNVPLETDEQYVIQLVPNIGDGLYMSQCHIPDTTGGFSSNPEKLGIFCAHLENAHFVSNILNVPIRIDGCHLVNITDLHQECTTINETPTPNFIIRSSDVVINNLFTYASPSKVFLIGYDNYVGNVTNVTLKNINISIHNTSNNLSTNSDLKIVGNTTVRLENCYRTSNGRYSVSPINDFGIIIEGNDEFNQKSFLYSKNCIIDSFGIYSYNNTGCGTIGLSNNIMYTSSVRYNSDDYNKDKHYLVKPIIDTNRMLSIHDSIKMYLKAIDTPEGIVIGIPKCAYKFLICKGYEDNNYSKQAIVNVCSAYELQDNGSSISGIKYEDYIFNIDDFVIVDKYEYFNNGLNIKVYINALAPLVKGTWKSGDIIVSSIDTTMSWMYDGEKWQPQYLLNKDYSSHFNIKGGVAENGNLDPNLNASVCTSYIYIGYEWNYIRYSGVNSSYVGTTLYKQDGTMLKYLKFAETNGIIFKTEELKDACFIRVSGKKNEKNYISISNTHYMSDNRPSYNKEDRGMYIYDTNLGKTIWWTGSEWVDNLGNSADAKKQGTSEERPSNVNIGFIFKDTTLNKLIVWDGNNWVNMDGTELSTSNEQGAENPS